MAPGSPSTGGHVLEVTQWGPVGILRASSYDGAFATYGENYAETGTTDRNFTGQNQDTISTGSYPMYDFLMREYHPTWGGGRGVFRQAASGAISCALMRACSVRSPSAKA